MPSKHTNMPSLRPSCRGGYIALVAVCVILSTGLLHAADGVVLSMAHVRDDAGKGGRVVAVIGGGAPVEIVSHEGAWAQVRIKDLGIDGWIHGSLVEEVASDSISSAAAVGEQNPVAIALPAGISEDDGFWEPRADLAGLPLVRVKDASTKLLATPDLDGRVVGVVYGGYRIAMRTKGFGTTSGWYQVSVVNMPIDGWVRGESLEGESGGSVYTIPLAAEQESGAEANRALIAEAVQATVTANENVWRTVMGDLQGRAQRAEDALTAMRDERAADKMAEEERRRVAEENSRSYLDTAIHFAGGLGDAGNGDRDLSMSGGIAVAWKREKSGLFFQGAGMLDRNGDVRRYGESFGVGIDRRGIGAFLFADLLQYRALPFAQTTHLQVRPTVRYRRGTRWSATGYVAIPLSADKLAHTETTDRLVTEAGVLWRVFDTLDIFNTALTHGGGEIRAELRDHIAFTFHGDVAEHGVYRVAAAGEYRFMSNLASTLSFSHEGYGDYPLLAQTGYGSGWSARVGVVFRDGGEPLSEGKQTQRLIVSPDYPLVVQRAVRTADRDVVETPPPVPLQASLRAVPSSGTVPLTVSFAGTISGGTVPYSYTWSWGDGTTATGTGQRVHTYRKKGVYRAILTVGDAAGGTSAASVVIEALSADGPLALSCSASPRDGDAPLAVRFQATATGGIGAYAYLWNFGDGDTSHDANPRHTYEREGTYTAVVTCTSGNESDRCSRVIDVGDGGGGDGIDVQCVASGTSGEAPYTVTLSAAASGGTPPYSFAWTFDDGASATGATVQHTYTAAGIYTAVVTVRDSKGHEGNCSRLIQVRDAPTSLDVSCSASPRTIIAPDSVYFSATATGGTAPYKYRWTFNDPAHGTSDEQNPKYNYDCDPGTYSAQVTVTDKEGQEATCEVSVRVDSPNVSLSCSAAPTSGAAPLAVQFDVTLSGEYNQEDVTFFWEFDDGGISIDQSPVHTYSTPGTYYATVIVTTGCVSEECEAKVIVN